MFRRQQVSLAFLGDTPSHKTPLGQSVIDALTANAETFPNPPITVIELAANNNALVAAVLSAKTGDHTAEANLEIVEETWNNNFRLTAGYVSIVADGNEAIIRLAGFTATKGETSPAQIPGIAAKLRALLNGNKGNFTVSCEGVDGAKAYVFAAVPEGASLSYIGDMMMVNIGDKAVYIVVSTRSRAQFANLPSGAPVAVSVYAVNSAGSGAAANGQHVIPQ